MKKSIILSIAGLTVAALSSYGQGSIAFDTYNAENLAGILTLYGEGPLVGTGLNSTFTGALLWSTSNPGDTATTAGTKGTPLNPVWTVGSVGTFATGAATAGYIQGPNLNISQTVGQNLFFEIAAFNGSGTNVFGAYMTGSMGGHSASFAATLVTGLTLPNANQLNNMAPFSVYNIPEPTTLALGGLGGLALLLLRRRQS